MIPRREIGFLILAVMAVSTAAVLIRAAGEAPPLVIAAYRLLLGSVLLALPVLSAERRRAMADLTRPALAAAILAGVFLAGHFATWIASLGMTNVASSIALVTAHPLIVVIGSRWLLGESVGWPTVAGIAIGLAGIAWLGALDHSRAEADSLAGDALAFAGCVFAAFYFLCGRWAGARAPFWPYVTVAYATAAVLLLIGVFVTGADLAGYAPRTYVCFVLLALVPQGVGHTLINRALRHVRAPTVSLVILGEVPGATLLAWLVLGEGVPAVRALAVATIVLAVAIALITSGREGRAVLS
jgi:drug/metabolite transporter (DMT)-like permease